jgi:hypothetical protein
LLLQGDIQYIGTAPTLMGDYNGNGTVDAADYVVWRKTDSANPAGYNTWRANFGRTAGGGAALAIAAGVPEPATWGLACLAMCLAASFRRRMPR